MLNGLDFAEAFAQIIQDDDWAAHAPVYFDGPLEFATFTRERYWSEMGPIKSLLSAALLLGLVSTLAAADPAAELASFSVFETVDLSALSKGDAKTAHGPPMNNSRFLSV